MGMMSLYDLILGESVVLNCTASYWSVVFTLVSHMTGLLFCLTLIGQLGHMTYSNCHCSFQLNCLHQVVLFSYKQEYSLILLHDFCSIGYKGPILHHMHDTIKKMPHSLLTLYCLPQRKKNWRRKKKRDQFP